MKLEIDRTGFKDIPDTSSGRSYSVPGNFNVWEYDYDHKNVTGTSMEEIKNNLSRNLANGISRVENTITKLFQGAGKFTFPGHGALKFKKPMVTKQGHLVATAEYASTNADGTVSFPDPTIPKLPPPFKPEPLTSQFPEAKADVGKPRLHWIMDFKYDPASKNGRLSFTGTNESSNEPLRFDYMRVFLVPKTTIDTRLFPSKEWKAESKSWVAKAIDAIRNFHPEDLLSWFTHDDEASQQGSATTGAQPAEKGAQPAEEVTQSAEKGANPENDEEGRKPKKKGSESSSPLVRKFRNDNVYGFATSSNWTGEPDLALEVESTRSLGLDAILARPDDDSPFTVARGQSVTIILQGRVSGHGNYQIKVQEEWAAPPGEEKTTQDLTSSVDWKMVQIFEDGRAPEYFDISDKAEEIEKARAK